MIEPVSEDAVLITLAQAIDDTLPARIASTANNIVRSGFQSLVKSMPSSTSLMVVYHPPIIDFRLVVSRLRPLIELDTSCEQAPTLVGRLVELPVYYSTETGPDLQ